MTNTKNTAQGARKAPAQRINTRSLMSSLDYAYDDQPNRMSPFEAAREHGLKLADFGLAL